VVCDIYAGLTAADWTDVGSTDAIDRRRTERASANEGTLVEATAAYAGTGIGFKMIAGVGILVKTESLPPA